MTCLIKGCNFVLKNIPHEAFAYQKDADPEFRFQTNHPNIFPYLLVNVGSGVSIVKVRRGFMGRGGRHGPGLAHQGSEQGGLPPPRRAARRAPHTLSEGSGPRRQRPAGLLRPDLGENRRAGGRAGGTAGPRLAHLPSLPGGDRGQVRVGRRQLHRGRHLLGTRGPAHQDEGTQLGGEALLASRIRPATAGRESARWGRPGKGLRPGPCPDSLVPGGRPLPARA